MSIKSTENRAAKLTNSIAHAERLLAALGGTPEGWEWLGLIRASSGPVADLTCSCGHTGCSVLYGLEKQGRGLVWVGSSCVTTYAQQNPVLVERIKGHVRELQAAARAERAAIKAQAVDVRAEALVAELRKLTAQAAAIYSAEQARVRAAGGWKVPYAVWVLSSDRFAGATYSRHLTSYEGLRQRLALKQQAAVIKRIEAAIEYARRTVEAGRAAMGRDE